MRYDTDEHGIRWGTNPAMNPPGRQLANTPAPRTLEQAKRDLGELMTGERGADHGQG